MYAFVIIFLDLPTTRILQIICLGSATHILVYHVHDNKDVFYRECQDGVKAVTVGTFRDNKAPMLFVGGNSSVHGYDHSGNEVFWTAVGDVVTSLILLDYSKDGLKEVGDIPLIRLFIIALEAVNNLSQTKSNDDVTNGSRKLLERPFL